MASQDADGLTNTIKDAAKLTDDDAKKLRHELEFGGVIVAGDVAASSEGGSGADAGSGAGAGAGGGDGDGDEAKGAEGATEAAASGSGSGAGAGGAAKLDVSAAGKAEPNWKVMPDAMLGTYLNTVISDSTGSESWKVNGMAEVARRLDTTDTDVLDNARGSGLLVTTLTALSECTEDENVVASSLQALRYMCRVAANKASVISSGGMEKIVEAMKARPTNAVVQEMACACLVNLASTEENQRRVGACGAPEMITAAIKNHRLNESVVWAALAALRNVTILDVNQRSVGEMNGIKVVANCLGAHRGSAKINEMGAGALRNLAVDEENRKRMVMQGGVSALAVALNAHKDVEGVQAAGLGALNNLLFEESAKAEMDTQGVAGIAKEAIKAHSKNIDIKTQANSILSVLDPKAVKSAGIKGRLSIFGRK